MDDADFLDLLYQQWSRTTGAENRYWMPEPFEDHSGRFRIYAVAEDQTRTLVAESLNESDADFISGLHGCLSDLIRRLHMSIDESDRLDRACDEQSETIAKLLLEVEDLHQTIKDRDKEIGYLLTKIEEENL